ncbi:YunG family protein [Nocardia abscessus]|uniref:YunG family protein n=1 Tax=Nocardia abscessus TaxID=120957 RepID=UPI002454F43E|nr:hypothetical protein [Nocardia abscessus]
MDNSPSLRVRCKITLAGILNTVATLPSNETVSHYFNIVDGKTIDLTRQQFPEGTIFTKTTEKQGRYFSTREYCLSYENTRLRYEKLRSRVSSLTANRM